MTQAASTVEHRVGSAFQDGEDHKERTTRFQGSVDSVTQDLIAWFGLTNTDGLTPFEIALRADEIAQACGAVITGLGATPVAQEQPKPEPATSSAPDHVGVGDAVSSPSTDPWRAAEQSTEPSTPSMFAADSPESPESPESPVSPVSVESAVPAGQAPGPARTGTSLLYARIERATSVDHLHRIWAENQAAFADDELMAAWKAKGRALQQNTPEIAAGNDAASTQGVAA